MTYQPFGKPQLNPRTITRKRPPLKLAGDGTWQLREWAKAMGLSEAEAWSRYIAQPDKDPSIGWQRAKVRRERLRIPAPSRSCLSNGSDRWAGD